MNNITATVGYSKIQQIQGHVVRSTIIEGFSCDEIRFRCSNKSHRSGSMDKAGGEHCDDK